MCNKILRKVFQLILKTSHTLQSQEAVETLNRPVRRVRAKEGFPESSDTVSPQRLTLGEYVDGSLNCTITQPTHEVYVLSEVGEEILAFEETVTSCEHNQFTQFAIKFKDLLRFD